MPSQKPAYRLLSDDKRHEAIAELAKKRGFKSVPQYLHWLIDQDANAIGFEMPDNETQWGGKRIEVADE